MIPPRYVKTASLTNHADHAVVVTAVFGSDAQAAEGNAKIAQTLTLAPAQTAAFPEQEYDMGGWTAVAALESLSVQPAAGANAALAATHFAPSVDGVVGVLHVAIEPEAARYNVAVVKQD